MISGYMFTKVYVNCYHNLLSHQLTIRSPLSFFYEFLNNLYLWFVLIIAVCTWFVVVVSTTCKTVVQNRLTLAMIDYQRHFLLLFILIDFNVCCRTVGIYLCMQPMSNLNLKLVSRIIRQYLTFILLICNIQFYKDSTVQLAHQLSVKFVRNRFF